MTTTALPRRRGSRGFTVVESLAAVAITATLAATTLPSIEQQLQRSRRIDALGALATLQLAQERWRANAPAYATLAELGLGPATPAGHYRLAVDVTGADGYQVTATAVGAQARDARCRVLRLTVAGADARQASGRDADVLNAEADNRRCWNR